MTKEEYERYFKTSQNNTETIPSEFPVKTTIGESMLGLMCPQPPYATVYDAILILQGYAREECPVKCGPDWSREHIELMLTRGPHRLALAKKAMSQLRQENIDKVAQGYARVVRWGDIKRTCPSKLKISPVAMIPHKSKLYRCILDLSCTLYHNGIKFASVNEQTKKWLNRSP